MNSPRLSLRFAVPLVAFALFLSSLVAVTAKADDLGQAAGTVPVPAGLAASDVKDAIVMAVSARQWTIQAKADDRVVAYLKHRSNEATLTLVYSATKVDLFCVGWKIDKNTGAHLKPEQPAGWLKYIREDLGRLLLQESSAKK